MRDKNYVVAILRLLACYAVISIHFRPAIPFSNLAVPIFVVLAFTFWHPSRGLGHRIMRLLIPYITWGIVGCGIRFIRDRSFDYKILLTQLTCGQGGNSPLYFLLLVMILSACVYTLHRMTKHWIVALWIFAIISIILQYSGMNVNIFNNGRFGDYYSTTFGRLAEFVPYVALGSNVGDRIQRCNGVLNLKPYLHMYERRIIWIVVGSVVLLLVDSMYDVKGFGYSGVSNFIAVVTIIIVTFSIKVRGSKCLRGCFWLSTFTGGIYYVHKLIGSIFTCLHLTGVILTLTTFILSFIVTFVISKLKGFNVFVK